MARPGDTGPCPLCGKEMGDDRSRYFHMQRRHGRLEHYKLDAVGPSLDAKQGKAGGEEKVG